jgi:hypothetical protein
MQLYTRRKQITQLYSEGKKSRKLYAELRKVNLLYAHFTQLYTALRTLRKAKTLYATLLTWQLADELPAISTTEAEYVTLSEMPILL